MFRCCLGDAACARLRRYADGYAYVRARLIRLCRHSVADVCNARRCRRVEPSRTVCAPSQVDCLCVDCTFLLLCCRRADVYARLPRCYAVFSLPAVGKRQRHTPSQRRRSFRCGRIGGFFASHCIDFCRKEVARAATLRAWHGALGDWLCVGGICRRRRL